MLIWILAIVIAVAMIVFLVTSFFLYHRKVQKRRRKTCLAEYYLEFHRNSEARVVDTSEFLREVNHRTKVGAIERELERSASTRSRVSVWNAFAKVCGMATAPIIPPRQRKVKQASGILRYASDNNYLEETKGQFNLGQGDVGHERLSNNVQHYVGHDNYGYTTEYDRVSSMSTRGEMARDIRYHGESDMELGHDKLGQRNMGQRDLQIQRMDILPSQPMQENNEENIDTPRDITLDYSSLYYGNDDVIDVRDVTDHGAEKQHPTSSETVIDNTDNPNKRSKTSSFVDNQSSNANSQKSSSITKRKSNGGELQYRSFSKKLRKVKSEERKKNVESLTIFFKKTRDGKLENEMEMSTVGIVTGGNLKSPKTGAGLNKLLSSSDTFSPSMEHGNHPTMGDVTTSNVSSTDVRDSMDSCQAGYRHEPLNSQEEISKPRQIGDKLSSLSPHIEVSESRDVENKMASADVEVRSRDVEMYPGIYNMDYEIPTISGKVERLVYENYMC